MDRGLTTASARQELLGSLRRPSNFNDWLLGAHYPTTYASQLERAGHLQDQGRRPRDSITGNTGRHTRGHSHRSKAALRSTRLHKCGGRPAQSQADERPMEASSSGGGTDNLGEKCLSGRSDEHVPAVMCKAATCDGEGEAVKAVRRPISSKGCSRRSRTQTTCNHDRFSTSNVGGAEWQSLTIRRELRNTYFQMQGASTFGKSFPALLTPLNRPLFHYYREDELPRGRFGITSGRQPSPSSIQSLKLKSTVADSDVPAGSARGSGMYSRLTSVKARSLDKRTTKSVGLR